MYDVCLQIPSTSQPLSHLGGLYGTPSGKNAFSCLQCSSETCEHQNVFRTRSAPGVNVSLQVRLERTHEFARNGKRVH